MEKLFEDLADKLSQRDCEKFEQAFDDFKRSAVIEAGEHQRILSSVIRKAGFEMNDNITVKRTRKSKKRIIGFLAAAAVLTTGAIGAGAYYTANRGAWNAVKYKFEGSSSAISDEQIEAAAEVIESITEPSGVCEINTFEDLDIIYEGAVADQENYQMLFTIKRKDGLPFEEKEGYIWKIKYSEISYDYDQSGTMYTDYSTISHFDTNPDGSLSLALDGYIFYHQEYEKYDYLLDFVDIYYVPQKYDKISSVSEEWYDLKKNVIEAAFKLTGNGTIITNVEEPFVISFEDTKLRGEEYDNAYAEWQQKDKAYTDALKEVSEYYYSGKALYRLPAASLKNDVPVFTKEQTGSDFKVTISPQLITLRADGNYDDAYALYSTGDFVTIKVYKTDGSVEVIDQIGGSGGAYELEDGTAQDYYEFTFVPEMPIRVEDIGYIMLNDVRINING